MSSPDVKKNFDSNAKTNNAGKPVVPDNMYVFFHTGDETKISIQGKVTTPDGKRVLMKKLDLTLNDGERAGLTGPNGGGKSSLFRIMAKLEYGGKGQIHITLPEGKRMMVIPQQMRMIPTTLPGILAYKDYSDEMATHYTDEYTHEQYEQCLDDAFIPELKVHLPWNAIKPDNIFPFFKAVIDNELYPYAGNLTAETAEAMLAAMLKIFDNKMHFPETVAEYYTEEYHQELMALIRPYMTERMMSAIAVPPNENDPKEVKHVLDAVSEQEKAANPEQNQSVESEEPEQNTKIKRIVFPGFKGRKLARNIIENVNNEIQNWLLQGNKMRLSGGEQQKLGFARAFLQASEVGLWLIDEATSALKGDMADALYHKLFHEKARGASAFGVIHNNDLLQHFTHHMELDDHQRVRLMTTEESIARFENQGKRSVHDYLAMLKQANKDRASAEELDITAP